MFGRNVLNYITEVNSAMNLTVLLQTLAVGAVSVLLDPQIIPADEPTGNLDGETQKEIMDIFRNLAQRGNA